MHEPESEDHSQWFPNGCTRERKHKVRSVTQIVAASEEWKIGAKMQDRPKFAQTSFSPAVFFPGRRMQKTVLSGLSRFSWIEVIAIGGYSKDHFDQIKKKTSLQVIFSTFFLDVYEGIDFDCIICILHIKKITGMRKNSK